MDDAVLDARGLSCPEPALRTVELLERSHGGTVIVLVDSVNSRDNVARTAALHGWQSTVVELAGGDYQVVLRK
ncbi:sulfurtransferase TusA family protein [Limnochorda pilosa]|uniref:Preprotein translocase subunit TatB n=1 Tax=Limnochorda pilosa TaxID=1555112 RepID=A0A0K2SGJ2_LIMPI|nr:sulfurtransferase TusA family protein [Limnochorda pilosa]BAS26228.1 preprotein translocase subunit TatB [Limnochorda pilosa]